MDEKKVEILFLNKSEVESLITVKDAVNAAEQAYRVLGEGQVAPSAHIEYRRYYGKGDHV